MSNTNKVWKVKEKVSAFAKYYFGDSIEKMSKDVGISEFTTFPMAWKVVRAKKDNNGSYLTGLSEEQERKLGVIIGKDLSKHSEFWRNELSACTLSCPTHEIVFNEGNIYDYILMKMAIASGHLAPSKTALLEDPKYRGTNFYLLDEDEEKTRKQRKYLLQDEAASIMSLNRNQKDKLLMLCFALNLSANDAYTVDDVYEVLKTYLKGIENNLERLESAVATLKSDPVKLQASFYFNKSIGKTITYDPITELYTFEGLSLASTREKSVEYLLDPEQKPLLNAIIKQYKARISKK